jgi:hypothetical protein
MPRQHSDGIGLTPRPDLGDILVSGVKRALRGVAYLFAILLHALIWGAATPAAAAQPASANHRDNTPAVPLAEALRRFAKESGQDVVFPEELVEGKQAAPVRDADSAYDALTQMLAGSGLVPRFTRPDAFVLELTTSHAAADMSLERIEVVTSPFSGTDAEYRWYGEKLLEASLRVLRESGKLGLRTYDFKLYVWLSSEGQVVDLEGYGGEEHQETLSMAKEILQGVFVGTIPPVNMPQPVGLRIVAQ